jgi:uncharacterized protein (DUF305 family)
MKLNWIFLGVLFGATASAQMENMNMDAKPSGSKFMQEMSISMTKMDHDMAGAPMNGNVDHDFVTMMIPHHQGAIDMAKGELSYGTDPAMRHLAQEIIAAQKTEIELMNRWLKNHADAKAKAEK